MTKKNEAPAGKGSGEESGFGLYIHWPFCASKCPYCDFNSYVRNVFPDQDRFARALVTELTYYADLIEKMGQVRPVSSIFFGGGTPSLMKPETLSVIMQAIKDLWPLSPDVEISMEANPTSVEAKNFAAYRKAGINRISLGIQSLRDDQLRFLGRRHNVQEAQNAIRLARAIFPRMSFDLIYARPGQGLTAWDCELDEALGFAADHLSLYQLTIEEGTVFHKLYAAGRFDMPDEELSARLFELTQERCKRAGLPAYEISNHARPGAECRHNLLYWRYGEYVGIGAGAHGRLLLEGGRLATANEKNPERWLERVSETGRGALESERLTPEEQGDEFLLMGLRITEGIAPDRYERIAGRKLDETKIRDLISYRLLECLDSGRIRITPKGNCLLNAIIAELA